MYSGPHIKRDGLVFGYDTGQFSESNPNFDKFKPGGVGNKRFFKGKPSINYAAHRNAVPQSSYTSYAATTSGTWVAKHPGSIRAYNAQGTDISYSSNSGVGNWTNTYHAYWTYDKTLKKPVIQMNAFDSNWKAKSFGLGMPAWSSLGVSAGDKYVISWLQWTTNTNLRADVGVYSKNTSNGNGFHDGRQSPRNTRPFKWERVHAVYTVSSNRNLDNSYGSIYMYGMTTSNGAGKILKIADVQLEINTDHPSDYLDSNPSGITTSRSSTESLIDLAKTTNIDVSNVSFDSNGLPTFDGTDDYIIPSTGVGITNYSQPFTMECVFKVPTGAVWANSYASNIFSIAGGYSGHYGFYKAGSDTVGFQIRDASTGSYPQASGFARDVWHHVVAVWQGGSGLTFYKNGEFAASHSTGKTGAPDTTNLYIGGRRAFGGNIGSYFQGDIPVAKYYNRALSPKEVQQNFRAYKNRFNI